MDMLSERVAAYWVAGGPLMVPLALVCLAIFTFFFRLRRGMRHWECMVGDGLAVDRKHLDRALKVHQRERVMLSALTAAAPLLGLMGTVTGMILTFSGVSAMSGDTAAVVAGGISQALITTQVGLVVALPGVFGLAHLRRKARDLQHAWELADHERRWFPERGAA